MMIKGWIKKACILLVLSGIIFSCKKDETEDTTSPTAKIILPEVNTEYLRGSTLMFSATFSDDIQLKECTVYITEGLKGWDDPWNPEEETFPLSGTQDEISNQYLFATTIPNSIKSSNYILVILVVDQALNYSRYEVPIKIR
ncbi:DUF4625 domain-containing protein [Labilibacter sediminis]|nr:DUF4625 domain-containing protein [Labilibacter sediminis]